MHSAPAMATPHHPLAHQSGNAADTSHEHSSESNDDVKIVLSKVFGHTNFRGKQEEAINNILDGKNCLIVLPTGGGKSVCCAVPALISDGVTVIICPLLSLMMDQVNLLMVKGT